MKKQAILTLLLCTVLPPLGQAETVFRGNIVFTSVANCGTDGPGANEEYNSQFHPRVTGNSNFTGISLVSDYGANGFGLDNANFGPAYKVVRTGGVGWGDTYTAQKAASIAILTQQPAVLTPSTPAVILTGKIKNVFGDPAQVNCEVSFRGVYARRLN